MNIRLANKEEARQIALIHQQEIGKGFLSSLPLSFLERFYEALIRFDGGICVVAEEGGKVIGFITGTISLNAFYKYFLSKYFLRAGIYLLPRLLNFRTVRRIIENLLYPKKSSALPSAELLVAAVRKESQGGGLGGQILQMFIAEMKRLGVKEFKLVVGEELKQAIRFYEKNGFEFATNITVHGKEPSRVYIYKIN